MLFKLTEIHAPPQKKDSMHAMTYGIDCVVVVVFLYISTSLSLWLDKEQRILQKNPLVL